ncbi:MAG: phosphate ABC transporter substrate-binding protein PstS, partial [Nitrosopumilaceae archaeon]|nr:phosphate ABC transporter substrate-binding protein PstS [Nitrosopumilaceae archaeon]NIU01021.1 phosphate ABC transporter substrate-binding protein PstS [Nitrosopumilaceae archaeon]NIU87456.1 phosphate ABC transporter substrate-binding protein PstS [Nitrosopumilaceae archaeon]NIV65966.1 phosphate ABC transporter substrate-binding protein PstS [Nitrosopumilaceae archaeon]NIX61623.1 phosphate ABC transporter substrate-binding protein PstS [Nitrosopumilaceae archaeon]
MITEGQDYSPTLLYVPLADKVVEIGKLGLSQVTYDGQTLWEYTAAETSEYQIPEWIKNNAKWWAEGQITDDDYIKGLQYLIDKGILKV